MCSPYYPVETVYPTLPLRHEILKELKTIFKPEEATKNGQSP